MNIKIFGEKQRISGKGRRLSIFGSSVRTDWRVIVLVGLLSVITGGVYAESRLSAVREAAAAGELRRGGEDTLEVPEATDMVRTIDERGPAPAAPAATTTAPATAPVATTTDAN
jgi:hypothetical protein